ASGGAYSQKLSIGRRVMIPLVLASIFGGLTGAFLLIKTPAQTFLHVLPWLMLGATLLFAFGKHLTGRISAGISHDATTSAVTGAIVWPQAIVMIAGSLLGGYSTAHFAQKLPQAWVKSFVILVGTAMTICFFIRGYR